MWGKGLFILSTFLLAYVLAEFVFHPDRQQAWEKRSTWGLIAHAGAFGAISAVLFLPLLNQGLMWWYIIFLSAVHFLMDQYRVAWLGEGKDADAVYALTALGQAFWVGVLAWYGRRPDALETDAMWLRVPGYPSGLVPLIGVVLLLTAARRRARRFVMNQP